MTYSAKFTTLCGVYSQKGQNNQVMQEVMRTSVPGNQPGTKCFIEILVSPLRPERSSRTRLRSSPQSDVSHFPAVSCHSPGPPPADAISMPATTGNQREARRFGPNENTSTSRRKFLMPRTIGSRTRCVDKSAHPSASQSITVERAPFKPKDYRPKHHTV